MRRTFTAETISAPATLRHDELKAWVAEMATLTQPDAVYWATARKTNTTASVREMVAAGTLIRLNPEKRPNSLLGWSDPSDVARVEDRTFICSQRRKTPAPPTTGSTRTPCARR